MLDALTLDQLRIFIAVADARSFRGASRQLARAQSAISRSIVNLEAVLGVGLFDRSAHRPALTPAGRALLADARAIVLKVDFMRARARGLGEGVELELGLVVDTWFPMAMVGAALRELHEAYPSVAIRLVAAPLDGPIEALRGRQCVLGITVSEDFRDPRITLEALSTVLVAPVVATTHPLAATALSGASISTVELAEHVQVLLEHPGKASAMKDFGVLSPETWRVTEQDTKYALILAGAGWGRLPIWMVERDLAAGRLVQIPAAALGPQGEIARTAYLAHRGDEPLGPAARIFRAALFRQSGLSPPVLKPPNTGSGHEPA
jgi:DNA-binding transcriptional LysR family regulator